MRKTLVACAWGLVVSAGGGCSPEARETEEVSQVKEAIILGDPVADPSAIGIVRIEFSSEVLGLKCSFGSGVMLTNSTVLTAAHVTLGGFDKDCGNAPAGSKADTMSVILPGSSGVPEQKRVFSKNSLTGIPPIANHPGFAKRKNFSEGLTKDVAVFSINYPVSDLGEFGPFRIDGNVIGHRRNLSTSLTELHWGFDATCLGYGTHAFTPELPSGDLRQATFQVRPFPAYNLPIFEGEFNCPSTTGCLCDDPPGHPSCNRGMFSVVLGGGARPIGTPGQEILPAPGDSGGPCIGPDNQVWGILSASNAGFLIGSGKEAYYTSSDPHRGMGKYVSAHLAHLGVQVTKDIDGDGLTDSVGLSADSGTFELVANLTNSLDTSFSTSFPVFDLFEVPLAADISVGDFDKDTIFDVLAVVGGQPFYFSGATGFDFNADRRVNYEDWMPPPIDELLQNGFVYFSIADYNGDGVDDAQGLREDGTNTYLLGSEGVGLTNAVGADGALATLRGMDLDVDGIDDVAIGAIGDGSCDWDRATSNCAGYFDVVGAVHLVTGDAAKPDITLLESDFSSIFDRQLELDPPITVGSGPGNRFGAALAWGNFDGTFDALAIGAPATRANGNRAAGNVLLSYVDAGELVPWMMIPEAETPWSFLGTALAAGDFDGDGYDDLALSAPGPEAWSAALPDPDFSEDRVYVYFGGRTDDTTTDGFFQTRQDIDPLAFGELPYTGSVQNPPPATPPHPYRRFGASLAVGDFNCDGFDDLAIGVPGARVGTQGRAGRVVVTYGSNAGLRTDALGFVKLDQTLEGIADDIRDDRFGTSLTAGNFNGDWHAGRPCVDLAIGAPRENVTEDDDGLVSVVYGGPAGLDHEGAQTFHRSLDEVPGEAGDTDKFGQTLSAARINADAFDDLLIGAPGEAFGAGAVFLFEGGLSGLVASAKVLRQGTTDNGVTIPGEPEQVIGDPTDPKPFLGFGLGDNFGGGSSALGGTSNGLIVIGAPDETFTDNFVERTGAVSLVSTSPTASVELAHAVQRVEGDFEVSTREKARFGFAVTGPRPIRAPAPASAAFDLSQYLSSGNVVPQSSFLPFGGFEAGTPWLPIGVTIAPDTQNFTGGTRSLSVSGTGFVTSPFFNPKALEAVGTRVQFDLFVPDGAPDTLPGSVELKVAVPARLLFASLGAVNLATAPQGEWTTISFEPSNGVRSALFETDLLATFQFAVTLPPGVDIRLDSLRFGGRLLSAPDSACHLGVSNATDYFFCNAGRTFSQSRALCQGSGMDLVTIGSSAEDGFVTQGLIRPSFIGGSDQGVEGDWRWSSTDAQFWSGGANGSGVGGAFNNWKLLQPAKGFFNEFDCAVKHTGLLFGKWQAQNCSIPQGFVCEQAAAAVPSVPPVGPKPMPDVLPPGVVR